MKLFSVWQINPLRWLGVVRGKDEAQALANLPQRYQQKLLRALEVNEEEAGPWKKS